MKQSILLRIIGVILYAVFGLALIPFFAVYYHFKNVAKMWRAASGTSKSVPVTAPVKTEKAKDGEQPGRAQVIRYSNGAKEVIYDDDLPPILQAAMWNGKIGNS